MLNVCHLRPCAIWTRARLCRISLGRRLLAGRPERRVRRRGLTRNRDLAETSHWTRRWKMGEGYTRCEYESPQWVIADNLRDTMRMAPCGHGACGALFQGIAASPSFCPFSSDNVSGRYLPSRRRQQKKAQPHHTHIVLGNGRLRFSRQRSSSLQISVSGRRRHSTSC